MRKLAFLCLFMMVVLLPSSLKAITYNIVVAKDGTGNVTTVQAAFAKVPSNSSTRTIIYIKNGTYKEMLNLASDKKNVTIIGQSKDAVILTYDNYATKINPSTGAAYGTSGSASTYIRASGFYALNVSFQNSAGPVGQALAIYVTGDKAVFKNCNFQGNQDTFYGDRCRQYFESCYFVGTTDFIFGPSTAVFKSCIIHSKGGTALTAASTESYVKYGYVFLSCTIEGNSGVKTDLGRPWRPYAAVAYLNCTMSSVINTVGWDDWGNSANQATARFGEYNNTGAGSSMSGRPAWIHRITSSEAASYTVLNVLKTTYTNPVGTDNWDPTAVITATKSAEVQEINNEYKAPTIRIYPNPVVDDNLTVSLNCVADPEKVYVKIYDLQGRMIYQESYMGNDEHKINTSLAQGMYIVSVKSPGATLTQKILVKK